MSTQQQRPLLYPNHKHFSQLTLVLLVVLGTVLMGLVSVIYSFSVTDALGENLIIPAEAELWSPLSE